MAPIVLTPAEKISATELGGADIKFLFEKQEVDLDTQAIFYHIGVRTISKLASFADSTTDLKQVLKDTFDLDPAHSLINE